MSAPAAGAFMASPGRLFQQSVGALSDCADPRFAVKSDFSDWHVKTVFVSVGVFRLGRGLHI
jgi:hypothetical protein